MPVINRSLRPRTTHRPKCYVGMAWDTATVLSHVGRRPSGIHGRHAFWCALPCRGGICDCTVTG